MLAVSPETFEEHVKFLNAHYDPVSLIELTRRIDTKTFRGNEACITFDDGYRDNLTHALPVLEKYQTPATIFITTHRLGEQSMFDIDQLYEEKDRAFFLSKEEIALLSKNPLINIGAHTHSHRRLSDLSAHEQEAEITKSKEILENLTGKKVQSFAYPFGSRSDFNRMSRKTVADLGFESAYENTGLLGTATSDKFSFPRINIRECDTNELSRLIYTK